MKTSVKSMKRKKITIKDKKSIKESISKDLRNTVDPITIHQSEWINFEPFNPVKTYHCFLGCDIAMNNNGFCVLYVQFDPTAPDFFRIISFKSVRISINKDYDFGGDIEKFVKLNKIIVNNLNSLPNHPRFSQRMHDNIFMKYNAIAREGGAYGSPGRLYDLGRNVGIFDYYLYGESFIERKNYYILPPMSIKKFCLGKGNIKKDTGYLLEIYKKFNIEFQNDDEADGFLIAFMAANIYGVRNSLIDIKNLEQTKKNVLIRSKDGEPHYFDESI